MTSRDREELRQQLEAAKLVTTAYSKVLQTPRDHFWPLSALPAEKETIKAAMMIDAAFQASQGVLDKPIDGAEITLRDIYIGTYAMLADFVSDDLAARVAPYWRLFKAGGERIRSGDLPDELALYKELTRLKPSEEDEQAGQKAQEEYARLADEMRAYLDRIAPRAKER